MLSHYSRKDLVEVLSSLGIQQGQNILLHCSMAAFGARKREETSQLLQDLINYLGPTSSIFVPTFTLWYSEDVIFNKDTPSQRMGCLAEELRKDPQAVRSACPMHSHAAIGPLADELLQTTGHNSTGIGSDFEIFYKFDFVNVFLVAIKRFSYLFCPLADFS